MGPAKRYGLTLSGLVRAMARRGALGWIFFFSGDAQPPAKHDTQGSMIPLPLPINIIILVALLLLTLPPNANSMGLDTTATATTIFVSGACGKVGSRLLRELLVNNNGQ